MSTMALARVPGSRTAWTCRDDVVAVGEDLLDLAARIREFLAQEIDELMESLRTVGGVGIVLGITWAEILRGFGEVLLIDARLVKLEHRPLVGFLPRAIAKGGGGEQYQSGGRDCEKRSDA